MAADCLGYCDWYFPHPPLLCSALTRQANFTVKTLLWVEKLHNISVVSKAA